MNCKVTETEEILKCWHLIKDYIAMYAYIIKYKK